MKKTLAAACAALWLSATLVSAHEGHEHKAIGTVAAVDARHIEVLGRDGSKTSCELNKDTRYQRGTAAAAASQVAVGQRVVVVYEEKDKALVAHQVLIGTAGKAAPAETHPHR